MDILVQIFICFDFLPVFAEGNTRLWW